MPSHPQRTCIVCASNTGKTNIFMNILNESKYFLKVYWYAIKLDEPLYQCGGFIDNWINLSESIGFEILECSNDNDDVIDLNSFDQSIQNLVVFDDMVCEINLDKVSGLFIRGRKSNCSMIFISQIFFGVPTQVRINNDYYIFTRNLKGNKLTQIAERF